MSASSPTEIAPKRLQARLAAATREELVALVDCLAIGPEKLQTRIDYLIDPNAAAKLPQRRIGTGAL